MAQAGKRPHVTGDCFIETTDLGRAETWEAMSRCDGTRTATSLTLVANLSWTGLTGASLV